ncbi:hypothetical protein GCM10017559_15160 [Streptosporangium longisporum]|uniref:Uncharacterized protein n=1 Tax=Streptosporangium longisporum TaxID=46187 RepID=A0ABN3XTQ2_9ACTN
MPGRALGVRTADATAAAGVTVMGVRAVDAVAVSMTGVGVTVVGVDRGRGPRDDGRGQCGISQSSGAEEVRTTEKVTMA